VEIISVDAVIILITGSRKIISLILVTQDPNLLQAEEMLGSKTTLIRGNKNHTMIIWQEK